MNFSVDTVLVDMEKLQETDNEQVGESEKFMEVFSGNECTDAALSERDDDPLNGADESFTSQMQFKFEYEEDDFLSPVPNLNEEAEYHGRKSKRTRRSEIKGPNGIVWRKTPWFPPISTKLPGFVPSGKGPARSVSNPLEAWLLLVDVPMLSQIVKATNEVIKTAKRKEPHEKRLTDMTEIKSWLGLHYLCGVLRNSPNAGPSEELWTLELGNAVFRATMTYKRFEFLSDCLQYADKSCNLSPSLDEVAGLWEKLVINCRSYYAPSAYCTINDHVLNLEQCNNSPLVHALDCQSISKGIRITTICDAKTLYTTNALIGINTEFIDQEVCQLVSDIKGTWRCLCLTERFSTMLLMEKLKEFQLQVVGAMPQTSQDIPLELWDGCKIPQLWYASNNSTLFSYLDENVKSATVLHTNGLSAHINAVKLYETINNANCKANEYMNIYSTKYANTNSNRWSLEFLYYMLNISAFNAWILYRLSENGNAVIEQRDFQRQLGLYLTQQHLKQRMHSNIKLSLPLRLQIAEILGEGVESLLATNVSSASESLKRGSIPIEKSSITEGIVLQKREMEKRRRCRACKSHKDSKIKTRCQQCLTPLCMRHLISRCEECSNYVLHSNEVLEANNTN